MTTVAWEDPAFSRPVESGFNKALAAGIGLLLAVTTLTREYVGTPIGFASRIVPVDVICAVLLVVLFLRHRMVRLPTFAIVYVAAVFLSLIPALLITPGPRGPVWTGFAAVLMAFGFYVAGLNVGASPALMRCLLAGLCVGVLGEAVIVVHDAVSPAQWFPDPMENRVRGTFKANGQLGAYGFCAAGILITFGATLATPRLRRLCLLAGILAASFVFLATRRTGMVALFLWGAFFLMAGWRSSGRRSYQVFLVSFLGLIIAGAALWTQISDSFIARRFTTAFEGIGRGDGFIHNQLRDVMNSSDRWFPFGFGVSKGYHINVRSLHEVHNGILAVAVEFGVLGLAGFAGLVALPLARIRRRAEAGGSAMLRPLLVSFMLACIVFMLHNTLFRDRTFLLLLGVATAVAAAPRSRESVPRMSARPAPAPQRRDPTDLAIPVPAGSGRERAWT